MVQVTFTEVPGYDRGDTPTIERLNAEPAREWDEQAMKRQYEVIAHEREGAALYQELSRCLNGDRDRLAGFVYAMRSEHPTLLGKLANLVLNAVDERGKHGDGRLGDLCTTVGEFADRGLRSWRVSEIRQRFI